LVLLREKAVKQYYYPDTNAAIRAIAAHCIQQRMAQYPLLLSAHAVRHALSLPQDVRQLKTKHLIAAGAANPERPCLVVDGWPCQGLSRAGAGAGLHGERSGLLKDQVCVLSSCSLVGALQQLQPQLPPAYLVENIAMQCHPSNPAMADGHFKRICATIGQPTMLDAGQFGSLAH
jgi:hypothetical protein